MSDIKALLARTNMGRESREFAASAAMADGLAFSQLCKFAFDPTSARHRIACAVLDLVCECDATLLQTHLQKFLVALPHLTDQSAIRVMARICMMVSEKSTLLNPQQRLQVATSCFDWLIGPHKVAAQVNAIYTLINLAKNENWIAAELLPIIQKEYAQAPASYRAAAKRAFKKLKVK